MTVATSASTSTPPTNPSPARATGPVPVTVGDLTAFAAKVFHAAWMSVALGVALEMVALFVTVAAGGDGSALGLFAGVLSKVSWSVIVCAALAVATAIPRFAVPATGITGLLVAPPAAIAAKVLQKVVLEALGGASAAIAIPLVVGVALIKGVEYLWLGAMIAWLGRRGAGFFAAIGIGGLTGLVFGGALTGINLLALHQPTAPLLSGFANELLFPVGCAVVLYGAEQLARRFLPPAPG